MTWHDCCNLLVVAHHPAHLTVIVGASDSAEHLRRTLLQRGVAHIGVATHFAGVRRSLVRGHHDLVCICITLDDVTLERHGEALQSVLQDQSSFPTAVQSIGLLNGLDLTPELAAFGCDIYMDDVAEIPSAIESLATRYSRVRNRQLHAVGSTPVHEMYSVGENLSTAWGAEPNLELVHASRFLRHGNPDEQRMPRPSATEGDHRSTHLRGRFRDPL